MEECQVDGQSLGVLPFSSGVGEEEQSARSTEESEEEEGLETDVVKIKYDVIVGGGSFRHEVAAYGDDGGRKDADATHTANNHAPFFHQLAAFLVYGLRRLHFSTEQGDGDEHYHKDDEHVADASDEGDFGEEEFEKHTEGHGEDGNPNGGHGGGAFPQKPESEHDGQAGIEEARVFLNILESLVDGPEQRRGGEDGHAQCDHSGETSDIDKFFVRSLPVYVSLINVHGENGGGAVENGRERGSNSCGEGYDGKPLDAYGYEIAYEPRVCVVGDIDETAEGGGVVAIDFYISGADDGDEHDDRDNQFEESGKDKALLSLAHTPRGQALLSNVLIESPIRQVGKPNTAHNGRDAGDAVVSLRISTLGDNEMEVSFVFILIVVKEHAQFAESLCEGSPVAGYSLYGKVGCGQSSAHNEGELHHVCPCHRSHAAINGIDPGNEKEEYDDEHSDGNGHAANGDSQPLKTYNLLNGQRTEPRHGGEVDEYIEEYPQNGEGESHSAVIPRSEKLGHGEHVARHHDGQEEFADEDEGHDGHDFVGGNGKSIDITRARRSDELLGGNVGNDERGAYRPPCQGVVCKEIAIGIFGTSAVAEKHAKRNEHDDIDKKYYVVDGLKSTLSQSLGEARLLYGVHGLCLWIGIMLGDTIRSYVAKVIIIFQYQTSFSSFSYNPTKAKNRGMFFLVRT